MTRFIVLFMVILTALFSLQIFKAVQDAVILPFTGLIADVCVFLVGAFDDDVIASGKVIRSTVNNFAVSIEPGCNGVEALIVLFAAIFAFPAPLKHKLVGFAVGFVAVQGLNLVRIISLFYLGQWSLTAFNFFHLYLWQALIILDALVVWLIWLRYLPPRDSSSGGTPPLDDGGLPEPV
ncbi:MAG: exosortase H [Pseudomonadota bacterium]